MALARGWERAVLRGIGARPTAANLRFLDEWHAREGGGDKNSANYNPLNTTQGAPGAGSMNSVGVKSYRSGQQGIRATVQTLLNGHYGDIVGGLRSGRATVAQLANSSSLRTWGTGTWGAGKAPGASGGSPGYQLASSLSGAQGASQGDPGAYKHLVAGYLLQQSNMLAGGQSPQDSSAGLLALVQQRAALAQPSAQAQALANGQTGSSAPLVLGNANQAEKHAVQTARQYLNTWYKWGGSSPKTGFDCSGLLQYSWGRSGVKIPRTSQQQWHAGTAVGKNQLRAGDAVFFEGGAGGPGHVGMYIGKGQFIESPHTGARVRVSNLAGRSDYVGARRFA